MKTNLLRNEKVKDVATVAAFAAIAGVCLAILFGCGPVLGAGDAVYQEVMDGKGCEPATAKCLKSTLMECNGDHMWDETIDCTSYEPEPRACCVIDGQPGCFLVADCKGAQSE